MNRKYTVKQKEFSDGLEEMPTISSENNPTFLLDQSKKYLLIYDESEGEKRDLLPLKKKTDPVGSYLTNHRVLYVKLKFDQFQINDQNV